MSNNGRVSKSFTEGDLIVGFTNEDAKVESTNTVATYESTNTVATYECLEFLFMRVLRGEPWDFTMQEDAQAVLNGFVESHRAQISFTCRVLAKLGLVEETNNPGRILGYRATMQLGAFFQP